MNYQHLSIEERETIQIGLLEKCSIREIARSLSRSPAAISREIKRHQSPDRCWYTPRLAQIRALSNRHNRGRTDRLKTPELRAHVIQQLKAGWSPEQIAGTLSQYLPGYSISHEAIYQYIYAQIYRQGYGYVKPGCEDLRKYLKRRRPRRAHVKCRHHKRVLRPDIPSIDERPEVVNLRQRFGDWESDSVASKAHAPGINTLVERKSGYVFITKLTNRTATATNQAIRSRLAHLPVRLRQTITFDNGSENQAWDKLVEELGLNCFFAHPYHAWERGTNENTNGLIRWYFPKGTNFTTIPEEAISAVEYSLNTRPRKRLGWKTPLQVLIESVALEG